jgi:predicted GIY-YIG superfamily endonuclease
MLNYDPEMNYYNCIYLLVDTINQTYYCGKTENLNKRIMQHRQNKKPFNKVFILEQDCEIMDMEYVWLNFFKNKVKVGWTCLNKDFNTGLRFRTSTKQKKLRECDLYESKYYKLCKEKVLQDSTGLVRQ